MLSIRYTDFGWEAIETAAKAGRATMEDVIAASCRHLLAELDRNRPAARLPRMPAPPSGEAREVELTLPSSTWDSLEAHAESQGAELPRLIEHAVMLHLSDLYVGRAARDSVDEPVED